MRTIDGTIDHAYSFIASARFSIYVSANNIFWVEKGCGYNDVMIEPNDGVCVISFFKTQEFYYNKCIVRDDNYPTHTCTRCGFDITTF